MSKVVLFLTLSLDGYFEGPDHDLSWGLVDEEIHRHFNDVLAGMGAFLEGRVTFELMAGHWPTADQDPEVTEAEAEFSRIWRDMPKIVFSRTLEQADWANRIVRDVTPDAVQALKAEFGDLVLGSADLASSFHELDLVDEYRLYVNPILLGEGRAAFGPGDRRDLRLIETRTFGNGVVLLHYERARTGDSADR